MAFPIVKTNIAFVDNGNSVRILVDGAHYGSFAKNKFSFFPNINAGEKSIDLVYVEQETSQEIMFRFNYDQITPAQGSLAAAMTYLEGIFFLAPVSNGGSPTFTNLVITGLSTLLNLIVSGATTLANLVVSGFTQLGPAPPFKVYFFKATFPSSQGSSSVIYLTGVDANKIMFIVVNGMWADGGAFMSNHHTWISSYEYDWYMGNGTNPPLVLCTSNTNSLSMLNKPCNITVFVSNTVVNP